MDTAEKRVAIMIESNRSFSRGLIRSVIRDARRRPAWKTLYHEHSRESGVPGWLRDWEGDGLLARVFDEDLAEFLRNRSYPVINLGGTPEVVGLPTVEVDERAVASIAVEFFLNALFSNFAFAGYEGIWFSDERQRAYLDELVRAGLEPLVYRSSTAKAVHDMQQRERFHPEGSPELTEWVQSLPPRTAILACNDVRALQLQLSIEASGRKMPEDLAVMGVGDDSVICELSTVPTSSIQIDTDAMTVTACRWLEHLMNGGSVDEDTFRGLEIQQQHSVTERASTDTIATHDPVLAEALRYIRSHCHEPINTSYVLAKVGRSRTLLDRLFRDSLGRSIAAEILRCRIDRAKLLIERTSLPLEQISKSAGFQTPQHFTRRFGQVVGCSPGQYREGRTSGAGGRSRSSR